MSGGKDKSKLSKPIVIISLTSIILGVAIMLITISVITGFQEGIRTKVIGFGSHIQITKDGLNNSMESSPILIAQDFYPEIENKPEIKKIQTFGYKPAILQSFRDSVSFQLQENNISRSSLDIIGVLFKGVDENYDWSFFEDKLVSGRLLNFDSLNNEIMISSYIAKMMGYKLGDNSDAFFIRDNSEPKRKKFKIVGIYHSGFEEFDKQLIFTQLQHIQKLNNWGVSNFITLADTCIDSHFVLKGITSGGSKSYMYDWGNGYQRNNLYIIKNKPERIRLISTDFELKPLDNRETPVSIPDTSYATILINAPCSCNTETLAEVKFESTKKINTPFGTITIQNGKGTHNLYTGGFEIIINKWEDLENSNELVYNEIPYNLKTTTITQMHRDIFAWLDLLDMNIFIIIVLLLIVSLINMITSLLVLILEKTNMIGIMKSMGGKNSSIRKVFIIHAMFLLSRGLLWGNILGLSLLAFQNFTGFFSLNSEVYSLDTVPVSFNLVHILAINGLTIVVCFIILIIPSYLVTKINPVKAIKFD